MLVYSTQALITVYKRGVSLSCLTEKCSKTGEWGSSFRQITWVRTELLNTCFIQPFCLEINFPLVPTD